MSKNYNKIIAKMLISDTLPQKEALKINALLELRGLNSKGDIIEKLIEYDARIKSIDIALPLHLKKELDTLGVNTDFYLTVYYKNGNVELINGLSEILLLILRGL